MKSYLLVLLIAASSVFVSCTKESCDETTISTETINNMAVTPDDLVFMRTIDKGNGKWKIRMNDIASNAYSKGTGYPPNSMIVKEKYDVSGTITGYDVMYRAPIDANASGGWLWSQADNTGHVIYDYTKQGKNCQSCHVNQNNIN